MARKVAVEALGGALTRTGIASEAELLQDLDDVAEEAPTLSLGFFMQRMVHWWGQELKYNYTRTQSAKQLSMQRMVHWCRQQPVTQYNRLILLRII
jgi:hypothetical protein